MIEPWISQVQSTSGSFQFFLEHSHEFLTLAMWKTSLRVIIKLGLLIFYLPSAGLKKVKSSSPQGERDILAGQVTFKADLTEGFSQVIL